MSMPGRSSGMKPRSTSEMDDFVVSSEIGTEMPYPSSHTDSAIGTCSTPAALMDSQKYPSLVAVVARAPVTGLERPGHGQVGDLLAVTEDAERRVSAQDLGAPDDAGAAAAVGESVIGDDLIGREGKLGVRQRLRQATFLRTHGARGLKSPANLRYQPGAEPATDPVKRVRRSRCPRRGSFPGGSRRTPSSCARRPCPCRHAARGPPRTCRGSSGAAPLRRSR